MYALLCRTPKSAATCTPHVHVSCHMYATCTPHVHVSHHMYAMPIATYALESPIATYALESPIATYAMESVMYAYTRASCHTRVPAAIHVCQLMSCHVCEGPHMPALPCHSWHVPWLPGATYTMSAVMFAMLPQGS